MSRNNVRGPTSALTEFLRASGITPSTIASRAATRNQQRAEEQPVAGPSRAANVEEAEPETTERRRRPRRRASGYASDELDEPEGEAVDEDAMDVDEEEEKPTPAKKRKLTKAAEAKLKAKEKKKRGKKDDDEDYEDDEEEDAYTALSRNMMKNAASKPPIGSFEKCAVCGKQFTVTKYTMASGSGGGFLCHNCAKAGGNDPFKKPAVPKKRKAPADKRTVTNFEEKRFPTLVSLCIQLITKHINDIDALGDIGSMNVEAISKALSKNRSLTQENVHLFYNPANASLALFDATNLPSPALETLAYHNANLVSLRLDFCGHLDDTAFKVFSTSLPALKRIELLGPFLVRSPAWQEFFKSHPILEGFLITQSPRFDDECIKALVKNCPDITDLRLKEVGKLDDSFLDQIKLFKRGLSYLDLSDPSHSCSEKAMIALIRAVGKTLTHLNVSNHTDLGDQFLAKGLLPHVKTLESLVLSHLPELTDSGVSEFFENWTRNNPLTSMDISRNETLTGISLNSILNHSGDGLLELNINGLKDVEEEALRKIGPTCPALRKLNVGFCRCVDDFVIKAWLEGEVDKGVGSGFCSRLEELKVWGCNKVTLSCPKKKGVSIFGVEFHRAR
ncbi:DNA repair protein rhp7 [Psilocybe cubensis]|uniref:DNA repair protein rhp7 n=2 Tax=Psilocybe cubensis TaxID=181762 RepID=A0ACB8H7I8_PSICU|nr:DNA repair protein rhp7 [Psilocybe cubensis]KAH9483476.1 DNA repair protein rhp7 [Psilocybe cubensis]